MATRSDGNDHHGRTGDGPPALRAKPAAREAPHQTLATGASPISACSTTCSSSSSVAPESSASPTSCVSYYGISTDACSLLAETEQFLAILDTAAPAFTTATDEMVPIADNTSALCDEGAPISLALDVAHDPQPPVRQRQNATRPNEKKKKKKNRRLHNDELAQLRSVIQRLEGELAPLQQENRLVARHNQIWQELASRQLRWRQHAEIENQQLKEMLQQVLHTTDPQQLDQFFEERGELQVPKITEQLPNYVRGPWKLPIAPPAMHDDNTLTSAFKTLLCRLDTGVAQIDAVFRENGMDEELTKPRSYAEMKTRRLGESCRFLEVVDVQLVPFDWRCFGDTLWNCTREWHIKDDPYVYQSPDRPEDTFAVNYRVTSKSQGNSSGQQSANYTLAVRCYWQVDRFVMVFASLSHGENELAGASVSDISYIVVSNMSSLSESGSSPVSVIQSCLHLFPTSEDTCEGEDGQEKAQGLLNLVVDAIHEDIAHAQRRVDSSLLLQRMRSSAGEDDEQTPRIRFPFRDSLH